MRATRLLPLVIMTVPASCASPASPPPAPSPSAPARPAAPPPRTVVGAPQSDNVTSGTWSYRQDERGSVALFGVSGRDALFTIRCDLRARRAFVSVVGTVSGTLTLRGMTAQKTFAVAPTGGTPPYSASEISVLDPILDALAYSRGHFDVLAGTTRLTIPTWPEFARVVEDCRG